MEKLNLPKIKVKRDKPSLSMDDYLKFVEFNLKFGGAKQKTREEKLALAVNVPFRLK